MKLKVKKRKKVVKIVIVQNKKKVKLRKEEPKVKKKPKERVMNVVGPFCGDCYWWLNPKINKFYYIHDNWAQCGVGNIVNGTGSACHNYLDPEDAKKRRLKKPWKMKKTLKRKVFKLTKKSQPSQPKKKWKLRTKS